MLRIVFAVLAFSTADALAIDPPLVFPAGTVPVDSRLGDLQSLNGYFPFTAVADKAQWKQRQAEIMRRILVSQGLWPEPEKTELNTVIHGRIEQVDYTIDAVYFESLPGHFVTGSLYRPKGKSGPFPIVLCPHGHWADSRFYDAGESKARQYIADGAERFMNAGRNHIQARCVQLARMGCVAFFYDMTGYSDSIQLGHRPAQSDHLDTQSNWGFFGIQAELRLQNMMGLQTWNSIRCVDFVTQLPDVDTTRIGVTGASGGGTQSMILAAIDDRITAAMPCVMVSTSMQGGCTCENAPLLRIGQGNIDIAAAIAPRPLGLTAADDWTKELETKGYPELKTLYKMLGHQDRLTAVFNTHFPHNYNHVNRTVMYGFFNRHFDLGLEEPVLEQDFKLMSKQQLTVWNDKHPAPERVGDAHEKRLVSVATKHSKELIAAVVPESQAELRSYRDVVGSAWETILGRRLDQVGEVKFSQTSSTEVSGFQIAVGRLDHSSANEQIPVMTIQAKDRVSKGVTVWLTDSGKSGLLQDGKVIESVAKIVNDGFTVVSADLIGQGEFQFNNQSLNSQRMWYQRNGDETWKRFAGYTYGFNHSLFVQRAHDVLSLVQYASDISGNSPVELVGKGKTVGPIALAARSQAGNVVNSTIINLAGFRFEDLATSDDTMFVSGAVKYLDVDGLLSLCAPHRVLIAGIDESPVAKKVYSAADAGGQLLFVAE